MKRGKKLFGRRGVDRLEEHRGKQSKNADQQFYAESALESAQQMNQQSGGKQKREKQNKINL